MGRRRRSLLSSKKSRTSTGGSASKATEAEDVAVPQAEEPVEAPPPVEEPVPAEEPIPAEEPVPAEEVALVEEPAPVPEPSLAEEPTERQPTGPSFPPESVLDEPHQVVETPYVPVGAEPSLDSTDEGWPEAPTEQYSAPDEPVRARRETLVPTPEQVVDSHVPPPQVAPDYDDLPPPTEEVPNAVLQDISQPYSAPMHVPEPPPIPGILDRFTPAGAQPRGRNPKIERRPSYIAATPTPPPMLRSLERPATPPPIKETRPAYVDDDELDESPRGLPVLLGLIGFVVLAVLALLFVLGTMYWNTSQKTEPGGTIQVEQPVPVVEPVAPVLPEPTPTDNPEAEDSDTPEVVPDPAPIEPAPATPRPVRPRPVRPAPPPKPDPAPEPEPVAELGTISIKSNRRVMVTIDGKAIGFTPRSYKAKAGTVTVSAMIPRQPQSKQTQKVAVRGGQTKSVSFTF